MSFPTSRDELEAAGYSYDKVGVCRGRDCRATIHWWWTPKGHRIPLNPDCAPHHATCKNEAEFRRAKDKRGA